MRLRSRSTYRPARCERTWRGRGKKCCFFWSRCRRYPPKTQLPIRGGNLARASSAALTARTAGTLGACVVRDAPLRTEMDCLRCEHHEVVRRGPGCTHHCGITGGQVCAEDLQDRLEYDTNGRLYRVIRAPRCPRSLESGDGRHKARASTLAVAGRGARSKLSLARCRSLSENTGTIYPPAVRSN